MERAAAKAGEAGGNSERHRSGVLQHILQRTGRTPHTRSDGRHPCHTATAGPARSARLPAGPASAEQPAGTRQQRWRRQWRRQWRQQPAAATSSSGMMPKRSCCAVDQSPTSLGSVSVAARCRAPVCTPAPPPPTAGRHHRHPKLQTAPAARRRWHRCELRQPPRPSCAAAAPERSPMRWLKCRSRGTIIAGARQCWLPPSAWRQAPLCRRRWMRSSLGAFLSLSLHPANGCEVSAGSCACKRTPVLLGAAGRRLGAARSVCCTALAAAPLGQPAPVCRDLLTLQAHKMSKLRTVSSQNGPVSEQSPLVAVRPLHQLSASVGHRQAGGLFRHPQTACPQRTCGQDAAAAAVCSGLTAAAFRGHTTPQSNTSNR